MADLSNIAKNAKKIKEQIAAKAGLQTKDVNDKNLAEASKAMDGAKKVVQEGGNPAQMDAGELKEIAGAKSVGTPEDIGKQKKIAMSMMAILPALIGYGFGGAEGGAIGAKVSSDALDKAGKAEADAEKDAREQNQKRELKEMDLQARKEENDNRREDRKAQLAVAKETAGLRADIMRQGLQDKAEKKAYAKSVEGKLEKLNSGDKARLDNSKLGLEYTQAMDAALAGGDDTVKIIGDNKFTNALSLAAEAFGRMQSGGAINKDEEARFLRMSPRPTDSVEMQRTKLQRMQKLFSDRMTTLGFKPEEFNMTVSEMKYGAQPAADGAANPFIPKANAEAAPDFDNMSDEELKAYLAK